MNISPVNAYVNQKAYVPKFQGETKEYQNLPQNKGKTKKVLLWSGLGLGIAAVAAFLLKGKGIKNLFKKPTSPEVSAEPVKPHVETPKPKVEAPKVETTEIPLKDTNPPKVSKLSLQETERNIENAGRTIEDSKTGLLYKYNQNGYVNNVYDANGNRIREIQRNIENSEIGYFDYVYDANGKVIREIYRKADGSVSCYLDSVYDTNGKWVRTIERSADGSVYIYTDYVLDANGNITRINYNPDGTVM